MAAESDPIDPVEARRRAENSGAAAGFYQSQTFRREPYLNRAREVAELTIPTLFRGQGEDGASDLVIPWNSIGAYCANTLASKIVFALFPPGRPNFKAEQDSRVLADLAQLPPNEQARIAGIMRSGLSKLEQDVTGAIEQDGDRARMYVAALRLLIGGNHGLHFYDDATVRGIPLERFVTVRDAQGNLLEWALQDGMDWRTIPSDIKDGLRTLGIPEPEPTTSGDKPVTVYTHGYLYGGKWQVYQEVLGMEVPGSRYTYDKDRLPYLFLPWILLDGEHYGRSYVEFYEGDLLTVESLTKTVGEGSAALARFIIMVSGTGMTNKKQVSSAKNGDVITGREADVYVLNSQGKGADFQVAKAEKDDAIGRLAKAFLLNSAIQRQGERVTAEEIRYAAQELEDALGGVYSQQVITWQMPYIQTKVRLLQKNKRVTPLPEGSVKITVTAGLAALARTAELSSLRTFAKVMAETYGPEAVKSFLKPSEFGNRVAAALGVDPVGLVPTEEELAEQSQAGGMQDRKSVV